MWTCPVCAQTNQNHNCSRCGFDHSTDFEQFPTLHRSIPNTDSAARLQSLYKSRNTVTLCRCCGGMITGNSCDYCGFVPGDPYSVAGQDAMHVRAARHATETIAALTDFSIVAYRYVWEPTRSRLELRAEKVISLGDARDFFNSIVWADQVFGQYRNGTGTELNITVTYRCKGIKKTLDCTIPTVKSDNFWQCL